MIDWLSIGAKVAEYQPSHSGGTATLTTIKRMTKTLIVLENDHRYRRDTLRRQGDFGWCAATLKSADDKSVREAILIRSFGNTWFLIDDYLRKNPVTTSEQAKAFARLVIEKMQGLLETHSQL